MMQRLWKPEPSPDAENPATQVLSGHTAVTEADQQGSKINKEGMPRGVASAPRQNKSGQTVQKGTREELLAPDAAPLRKTDGERNVTYIPCIAHSSACPVLIRRSPRVILQSL